MTPLNCQNFWIEIDVDGRKSKIACGPHAKDGGFKLTVKMRRRGKPIQPLIVLGWSDGATNCLRLDWDDSYSAAKLSQADTLKVFEVER